MSWRVNFKRRRNSVDAAPLRDRVDQNLFETIYSRALVYNTCWEDPAVDRQALELGPEDHMVVITIACIEGRGRVLSLPGLTSPYYVFVGRKCVAGAHR
jgi:S-adenosylmethionine:diacylglycerol 3-amino-3-carboxypropyl transferase